ncbi:(2Fe-2S)-binding protein [Streptomyces sp. 3MP-14]|uniref:Bacterioferritin-associated ferredoxin n=1 Tax=Streptomyces mimosae TaxID=2586635 RepID=A0A5N6AKK1_9ACTN|nr:MULTISPECIES: (2Fe-2S)-binding protein [Streptomyces]KAB8168642.1 (2Fe-2S)-binding protein [Streptomyces mimosae]KAB8178078.1 (2Fe-2S)-binding protein [Streptomyces sp. 3MP-14]
MYVCSCFGVTEEQVRSHAAAGACTPRRLAAECRAGTDCGSCVRRIQGLLGRACPRPEEAAVTAVAPAVPEPATPPALPAPAPAVPAPSFAAPAPLPV